MSDSPIIIIGGGWAGLATAVRLTRQGYPVTLLEAGKQLGGRARSSVMGEQRVDNGQHLMLGAYSSMLDLLQTLGVAESEVFLRTPLRLNVQCLNGEQLDLRAPALPAPLHLLVAFLRCKGISWKDKLLGLVSMDRLMKAAIDTHNDISVSQLLTRYAVPTAIQTKLQIPLCIAALNTAPEQASAQIFVNVLREAFKHGRAASDLLIPTADLDALLPKPARVYLQQQGAELRLESRVSELLIDSQQGIRGVKLASGECLEAQQVVLAANYPQAGKLLARSAETQVLAHSLSAFNDEPIITLYYQFDASVKLDFPMLGTLGGYAEWVFDRRIVQQPGLLAVVISASGPHTRLGRNELAAAVLAELRQLLGNLPEPEDILVLKESRATFSCRVGIEAKRPGNRTAINGLWLAADYTQTGFPATLEGAVRSGYNCADLIARQTRGSE